VFLLVGAVGVMAVKAKVKGEPKQSKQEEVDHTKVQIHTLYMLVYVLFSPNEMIYKIYTVIH
jgi:hypothetical protein